MNITPCSIFFLALLLVYPSLPLILFSDSYFAETSMYSDFVSISRHASQLPTNSQSALKTRLLNKFKNSRRKLKNESIDLESRSAALAIASVSGQSPAWYSGSRLLQDLERPPAGPSGWSQSGHLEPGTEPEFPPPGSGQLPGAAGSELLPGEQPAVGAPTADASTGCFVLDAVPTP